MKTVALKIDVDTERGTRIGVPNLMEIFKEHNIRGTFLFSMGPDNTGRAIRRVFRPGFFEKVNRTSVLQVYGLRTLMNGVLVKGPHIGERHGELLRSVKDAGHEVGVHCYDHVAWQDKLHVWSEARIREEVNKAAGTFKRVFGCNPHTMGSAGWQANRASLSAYDDWALLYASDMRGTQPFFPIANHRHFNTLQIPTTLPTLDEMVGRVEYPMESLVDVYHQLIDSQQLNVLTIHAELEGMHFYDWFKDFVAQSIAKGIRFVPMENIAHELLKSPEKIVHLPMVQGTVDGRSGKLAMHG